MSSVSQRTAIACLSALLVVGSIVPFLFCAAIHGARWTYVRPFHDAVRKGGDAYQAARDGVELLANHLFTAIAIFAGFTILVSAAILALVLFPPRR